MTYKSTLQTSNFFDPLKVFHARALHAATLWQTKQIEFELKRIMILLRGEAKRMGLLRRVGKEEIERLLAAAFVGLARPGEEPLSYHDIRPGEEDE